MISDRSIAEVPAYFAPLGRLRMLGGDAALDFANTRHWRDGKEIDFLTGYPALADWAVPAGLIDETERAAIAKAAERLPEEAKRVHALGLGLRDRWNTQLAGRPFLPTWPGLLTWGRPPLAPMDPSRAFMM